jgi:mRNA interferase MazF
MPGKVTRGTVVDVNLDPTVGHEIKKTRRCVVIQNDIGNRYSPLTIVAPIWGAEHFKATKPHPVMVFIAAGEGGTTTDSYVLCNQIRSIDEQRLGTVYGKLHNQTMKAVDVALRISLAL